MQYLIDFAEDYGVRHIAESATKFAVIQGVVLDVDRFWLRAWYSEFGYGPRDSGGGPFFPDRWWGPRSPYIYPRPLTMSDLSDWRPPDWEGYLKNRGLAMSTGPIVVKLCLRPSISVEEKIPSLEQFEDKERRVQVMFELRSLAELAGNPRRLHRPMPGGVSIGIAQNDFGTLCINLTDKQQRLYAITCAHVVPSGRDAAQPASRDSRKSGRIGTSVVASALVECAKDEPCNPWSGTSSNELDVSLIEVDSTQLSTLSEVLDIGSVKAISSRASLSTAQAVEVMGRTTKLGALQIGGLAVWYQFQFGNKHYCFRNLFEVESPYGAVRPIRNGDSGAPVCTPGSSGNSWCGMVAGCDHFKGYAIYSETIEGWWRNEGYDLTVT